MFVFKERLYAHPVVLLFQVSVSKKFEDLKIPVHMLGNTWREIDYRLDVLRATKGAHVEVY